MKRFRLGRILVALLAVALLAGCARSGRRQDRAAQEEEIIEYEEFQPTTAEQLPEPRIGEDALIDERAIGLDSDRGERIGNEFYATPPEGELKIVYFDYDNYHLRPDALATLKNNALYLIDQVDARVLVEGHCDDRGSQEYNLSLGEKRAKEVRDYLIEAGVHPDRVKIISYGEERPAAPNGTEEGWGLNRRAEFKLAR